MDNNILNYILKNFYLIYKINSSFNLDISHSPSSKIYIKKGSIEGNNFDEIIKKTWNNTSIYFLHNKLDLGNILEKKENSSIINYDIIASSFYLLSGKQELNKKNRDHYGRFTYNKSVQKKYDFCNLPLVNYYFDILKTAIEHSYNTKIEFRNNFSATLTHDIDEVSSAWKHRAKNLINANKKTAGITSIIKHFFKPFTPWKNLLEFDQLYKKNNIKASFFFLTRNDKINGIKNADYKINSSYLRKSITKLNNKNHEIGIHGSYKTHDDFEKFEIDIKNMPLDVFGGRFHFLQFSIEDTPKIIQDSNLMYDSTLGFQEKIGFRNSICTPFYLYNFNKKEAYDFIEIPLNVMDCTFAFEQYMNLSPEIALTKINNLLHEIKKFNGNLCVNWHNTFYSDYLHLEWKKAYQKIIKKLIEEGFIFLTCKELTTKYGDNN